MKRFILFFTICLSTAIIAQNKPNIILMMADDLGYGDVGFNGNTVIKTPNMDAIANSHLKLTNFYAGAPVCSPTRGTCLTGRHAYRYGIFAANEGHLPAQEVTLAKLLKQYGYTTGHFGKWHIGTLDPNYSTKGDSRDPAANFAPPWQRDYDVSFVTESSVSTWDPMSEKVPYYYNGVITKENLLGDDSRVMMDRVIPFIENAVLDNQPFLSVIWFHAPHEPFVAGPSYKAMYEGYTEDEKNYYGCITAMDEQIGRLHNKLEELQVDNNTIIFFCSDNGPEGKELADGTLTKPGVTGGLRGRKRSLYCGGTNVPAFIVWPGKTDIPRVSNYTSSTLDYLPTILEALNISMPDDRPIDGISMLPMLDEQATVRSEPLPFMHAGKAAWIDGNIKFVTNNNWEVNEVYNLYNDRAETTNLKNQYGNEMIEIQQLITKWSNSCAISHSGGDYSVSFTPVNEWKGIPIPTNTAKLSISNGKIFPNPASEYIQTDNTSELKQISIYDTNGALIKKITQPIGRINIAPLQNGVYIIKAINKNGLTWYERLLVQ